MSDLKELLREEVEHAERNKDAAPSGGAKSSRPGRDRAKVLSVRPLNSICDSTPFDARGQHRGQDVGPATPLVQAVSGLRVRSAGNRP